MTTQPKADIRATIERPSWVVRPGVRFPHWPSIQSPAAETALRDILDLLKIEKCWRGYGETEDKVRRLLLGHYGAIGSAPTLEALAAMTRMTADTVREALLSLRERDLVVFDPAEDRIAGAYPFTERDSGHRVQLGGAVANAMCAIDALGAGAMFDRDASVASRCRACAAPIRIKTAKRGTALASIAPAAAVVWSGLSYADNCAASSLCTVIAFFCSDAHLDAWRTVNHPGTKGHRLSIAEAHEVGMAIFRPMLAVADW